MSKRTQSIRSLFAGGSDYPSAEEGRQPAQRVASGAVRSLQDTFSEVERENEELKQRIAEGALPIEINPSVVDPSPFADRFPDQDVGATEGLKASIAEHGQEIPILVRPHPVTEGRYQVAYGHRRVRATAELGIPVKAYVRELDDSKLIVAQGIENSAREDLSFVERASFALKLENSGFPRPLIQAALSVDRAEVSKLIAVAQAVPEWVIEAVGRAPKIGRGRWQELADLIKQPRADARARKATEDKSFSHKDSDARFQSMVRVLKQVEKPDPVSRNESIAKTAAGAEIATLSVSAKHCKIQINRERDEAFASFLMEQLPSLYESFNNRSATSEG